MSNRSEAKSNARLKILGQPKLQHLPTDLFGLGIVVGTNDLMRAVRNAPKHEGAVLALNTCGVRQG